MNRRRFVRETGALALGAAIAPAVAPSAVRATATAPAPRRLGRIGLELYTVRNEMRRDFDRTLAAVRAIGYTDVELLWSSGNFGRSPAQMRAALQREGLRAPSAHISPTAILVGWARSLDTAKMLGHESLIVPSFTADTQRTLDDWREWADHFNRAGEQARKAGLWLAFHNEPDHMKPIDGVVPYDVFIERTDPSLVRLQLDVGNMAMGGGDPMRYLERHRDRYWSFHLKDVVGTAPVRDTELGAGRLDFKRLLAAVPDIDRKVFYIEQEGATDAIASSRRSHEYLRALEF
jgi:sugar phosphate isomerase/epimerase